MTYNMTCIQNATSPGVLAACSNTATDGLLFGGLSVALFIILLIGLRRGGYPVEDTVLVSSFALFIITAIMAYGKFLNIYYPLAYLIILAFTGLYVWVSKNW